MYKKLHTSAYTFVEAIIVIVAFFIVVAVSVPIISHLEDARIEIKIQKNIKLLKYYSDRYFEENEVLQVSLYELVGPKNPIPNLKYFDGEHYPDIIFKGEAIKVETKRYGILSSVDS